MTTATLRGDLAGGTTAALLRAEIVVTYGPRAVVASLISATVLPGLQLAGKPADATRTLHLVFAVSFAAGLFQALFGALRLGSLVRYIPSPVMAGFQNAAAILILLYQLDVLLGLPERTPRRPPRRAAVGPAPHRARGPGGGR